MAHNVFPLEPRALSYESCLFAPLEGSFYARDALAVARALIGTFIVHNTEDGGTRTARIVETEAYRGPTDAACHARAGLTARTRTLYGPAGHAYVFLIYGMYECFNVVCYRGGKGHAVLVRAVEPLFGVPQSNRTDGPGRLTRALGISRAHNGIDLGGEHLFIAPRRVRPSVGVSARVGVAYAGPIAEAPWRFFDTQSPHVSKPNPRLIGLGKSNGAT